MCGVCLMGFCGFREGPESLSRGIFLSATMEAEIRDEWKICVVTQNHKGINDNQEDNAVF